MLLYRQTASPATLWPEPIERVWQMLPGGWERDGRFKRPDITISDRLFIGATVNIPRGQRPWGVITWLADAFRTSRQTIYTIGERTREGLLSTNGWYGQEEETPPVAPPSSEVPTIAVTEERLKRTILTLVLPGGVPLRPMQECLQVAFDISPSLGFLSQLINQAGRRAGQILDEIDYSPLGEIVLARDETFFDDLAFLVAVEPHSHVLLSGDVEEGCDGETWGVRLAMDHGTRGLRIVGLAEDAARYYPGSLQEAASLLGEEFSVPVQKDVWHVLARAGQTVIDVERMALRKLGQAEAQGQALEGAPWDEAAFYAWADADEEAEALVAQSSELRFWVGCLYDALEIVDWRSGEIRDREINQWLLDETIQGLRQLDHPRIRSLVTYLEGQRQELLTFLDWLEVRMIPWQRWSARVFPDEGERSFFQATVARAWRLSRALVNGHAWFRQAAEEAQALLDELIADHPEAHALAEELLTILEGVIRTSCATETVASILKPYLWVKRSFQSRETAQNWYNLFRLWFNMHLIRRGERAGKSPFQWAGIKVYTPDGRQTDDWLEASGYPATA